MNRVYTEQLFERLSNEQRKKVLRKMPGRISGGFRGLDSVPLGVLKGELKRNEEFAGDFLDAVADVYGCSLEQYASEDRLPELTSGNFLGLFARKCKSLDSSQESCKILEEMLQKHEKLTGSDLPNSAEAMVVPPTISENLEQGDSKVTYTETDEQPDKGKAEQGEDYMSECTQYIGYIQENNAFYNFKPVYIVNPDSIEQLHDTDVKSWFPEFGNINLYSWERGYVRNRLNSGDIVVLTLAKSDFEENVRLDGDLQRTNYKVDLKKLERQDKVKSLADIEIYPVLHPVNQIDFAKKKIILKENWDKKDPCLIEGDGILYGPYKVERDADRNAYVNLPSDYIVDSYRPQRGNLDYTVTIDILGSPQLLSVQIDDKLMYERLDKMPDQELFQAFQSSLESRKDHASNEITPNLVDEYVKSCFRGLSDEIINNRIKRIQLFIEEQFRQEKSLEGISRFVANVLLKYGKTDYFYNIMEYVLNNSDLARKIQSFAIVEQRLKDMRQQYEELQQKRDEAQKKWDEEEKDHNRQIEELASRTSEEIRTLTIQKENLQREIDEIREQKDKWKQIKDLNKEKDFLDRRIDELKEKQLKLETTSKQAAEKLETELKTKLGDAMKSTINAAFDGKIADQVLQAAAKWNQTTQDGDFKRIAATLTGSNENLTLSGDALVEYLISSVKRYRPGYSQNDILNIFLCVTQNFLTVFSGEPGTGKTSISNIVAHILGTSKVKDRVPRENGIELGRYVPISIERGWTSKRDFIGYYNPLSQAFEQANKHLYDGLRLLDAEGEQSKYPYIVLLDEANLSPIEYYWADFMNICDSDSRFSKITLGKDIQLRIPSTLRFIATINSDDTTERLSPRLIDRAALIRLPNVPYTKVEDEDIKDITFVKVVEWSALQSVFAPFSPDASLDLDAEPNKIYKDICNLFRENMKFSVSPRVDRAIRRYWATAKNLFESEAGNDPTIIALDYAVAQKLLPKISGSGKAYRDFLDKFQELCAKNNLENSRAMLVNIIKRGEASMNYYQYF